MNFWSIPLILAVTTLAACTDQNRVPQQAGAPGPEVESAIGVAVEPQTQSSETRVEQVVVESDSASISNQIDQLSGRLTLVQEQIINQRNSSDQQLELSQAILQRLQLLTQSTLLKDQTDSEQDPMDLASVQQLDAAINQLLQVANEMQIASGRSAATGDWEIESVVTNKGWVLMRYKPVSGATWLAESGAWIELGDTTPLSSGNYALQLEPRDTDSKGYVAVRINKLTGDTWWLNDRTWQAY